MTSVVNIEANIDMNTLFHFNYNFDILKSVIEGLLISNKATNQKINDIMIKLEERDIKISKLEKKLSNIENIDLSEKNFAEYPGNPDNSGQNLEILNDLKKRLNYLEIKLSTVFSLSQDFEDIKAKNKLYENFMNTSSNNFKDLYEKINKINETQEKLDNQYYLLDQILSQNQFFKNGGKINFPQQQNVQKHEDNDDDLNFLFKSFEKKTLKKFELLDERNKKIEEEISSIKHDNIQSKCNHENANKNFERIKSELDNFDNRTNEMIKHVKNLDDNKVSHIILEERLRNLNNSINKDLDDLSKIIEGFRETFLNTAHTEGNGFESKDLKLLKDLQKRFSELEKNFKTFCGSINIENINREIKELNESVINKITNVSNVLTNYGDNISTLSLQQNMLKDTVDNLIEDRTTKDELLFIRKRIESISNAVNNLKNLDDSKNNSAANIKQNNEVNKYLEIPIFNDFKSSLHLQFNSFSRRCDEIGRIIDDILTNLDSKINLKDLKLSEDTLKIKIEELRTTSIRRFADKAETFKQYKYLDTQVKSLFEVNKNKEKGDNWLLAKKPVNGYSCASCEAYIGELNDNVQPVHWNKYPNRDISTEQNKLYRVGSGFSKMLQLLNFEGNNNKEAVGNNSNNQINLEINQKHSHNKFLSAIDFYKPESKEGKIKELSLPKVKIENKKKLNASSDNIDEININNINNNLQINQYNVEDVEETQIQPKVVKIYKRIKEKKEL